MATLSGINQQEPFVLFQVTQLSLGVKTTAKSIVVNSANFANFVNFDNFANEKREAVSLMMTQPLLGSSILTLLISCCIPASS